MNEPEDTGWVVEPTGGPHDTELHTRRFGAFRLVIARASGLGRGGYPLWWRVSVSTTDIETGMGGPTSPDEYLRLRGVAEEAARSAGIAVPLAPYPASTRPADASPGRGVAPSDGVTP